MRSLTEVVRLRTDEWVQHFITQARTAQQGFVLPDAFIEPSTVPLRLDSKMALQ